MEAKPVEANLWEQSLLAMNDDAVGLKNRVACIASKLCSHSFAPISVLLHKFLLPTGLRP